MATLCVYRKGFRGVKIVNNDEVILPKKKMATEKHNFSIGRQQHEFFTDQKFIYTLS